MLYSQFSLFSYTFSNDVFYFSNCGCFLENKMSETFGCPKMMSRTLNINIPYKFSLFPSLEKKACVTFITYVTIGKYYPQVLCQGKPSHSF